MRSRRLWLLLTGLAIGVSSLLLLDAAGAFRPKPTPEHLVRRMVAALERTPAYRVDISVAPPRGRTPDTDASRQWLTTDGTLHLSFKDHYGFVHFQEWLDDRWLYHQAGANFQAEIKLRRLNQLPYGRWALGRMPSLQDLARVIREGDGTRLLGWKESEGGKGWAITVQPPKIDAKAWPENARTLYNSLLGSPWLVQFSEQTHLPMRITVPTDDGEMTIRVRNFEPGITQLPVDWKRVNDTVAQVRSRYQREGDALSPTFVRSIRAEIDAKVTAWRSTLYKPLRPPTP